MDDTPNTEVLNFIIMGVPSQKQSTRFAIRTKKNGEQFVQPYPSEKQVIDTGIIRSQIIKQLPEGFKPWSGGIMIRIQYVFPFPSKVSEEIRNLIRAGQKLYKITKPDLDNCDKLLFDAMAGEESDIDEMNKKMTKAMKGKVYVNDGQICSRFGEKIYGDIPMTQVSLKHLGINLCM